MHHSNGKPSSGVSRSEGLQQATQQEQTDSGALGTVLERRIRLLESVQAVAHRNHDQDTFRRAHRAWQQAKSQWAELYPEEAQRRTDERLSLIESDRFGAQSLVRLNLLNSELAESFDLFEAEARRRTG